MSWTDVKHVVSMEHRWKDPLHFAVMTEIAKRYNPTFGYAWPALKTIGLKYGRSPGRINRVTVELETSGLLIRLGPDPETLGSRQGTQRFVPIWRVENGVQQQLRDALEADDAASRGAKAVENSGERAARDLTHDVGACRPRHGGHVVHDMGGMSPTTCDQDPNGTSTSTTSRGTSGSSFGTLQVPFGTGTATAAAQPRLPTVLAQIRRTLVEELLRKKRAFLASLPANDDNWKQLLKAACDVLRDPTLGARLVKGYDATLPSDVAEAVRLLCDKRHIDWGKPSYERVRDAAAAAEVLLKMRSGELDQRPRELRRTR